jgi:hypothetical protein
MVEPVLLDRALYLPAPDVKALAEGRVVAAIPKASIEAGWSFLLYPGDALISSLSIERQYNPDFLSVAKAALTESKDTTVKVGFWAKCESCVLVHEPEKLDILSRLTTWTPIALRDVLQQQQYFFLACLRIYQLPEPIEVPESRFSSDKVGKFVSLSSLSLPEHIPLPVKIETFLPVLGNVVFSQRKQQLVERKLPLHPELENLYNAIAQLATVNLGAKELEQDIKVFLGWTEYPATNELEPNLDWIKTIVGLGNRSKELDQGKSNYQAGTDFENVVHKSLEFLGFTIDEAHRGGAGGLDLFCSKPYPLVGECKAGKGIPSRTTEELIKLGGMRLGKDRFLASAKLIIGPGNPTSDVLTAAQEWRVSIINPMSLQKLVELKAKYPGSIDLIELKKYLEPGQIDHKIDEYINKVLAEIKLRVHITQILKGYLERVKATDVDINTLFGVYVGSNPPEDLTPQNFYKILIELSSPLTGYLGRRKGDGGSDRFYFLRHMLEIVEQ